MRLHLVQAHEECPSIHGADLEILEPLIAALVLEHTHALPPCNQAAVLALTHHQSASRTPLRKERRNWLGGEVVSPE